MHRIRLIALAVLLILGSAAAAIGANFEIPESVTMSPKRFEGYTPKKGEVTFNHVSHMQIACQDCHHTVADTFTIQSCMSEGCHDNVADRTQVSSVYRTFHTTKDTTKSCVGCHRELKKTGSDAPLACNSCHVK
jgi:DNA-directed RNA polymerase subunit RPC12/RpoP